MGDPRPYRPRDTVPLVVHRLDADSSRTFPENRLGIREWGLWYTFGGFADWGRGLGKTRVSVGEAVLVRPDTPHHIRIPAGRRWRLLVAHFVARPHWAASLGWPAMDPDEPGIMRLKPDDPILRRKVERHLAKVYAYAHGGLTGRVQFALAELELALLWLEQARPGRAAGRLDPRVQQALNYLAANLNQPVARPEVAEAVGLSEPRLAELFRQQLGLTPMQYLEERRMSRAMELLATTSMLIGEVAAHVGFHDPDYFTNRFRRRTGLTPLAYRRDLAGARRGLVADDQASEGGP